MSIKADLLAQFTVKEDDDRRRRTYTISDRLVSEAVWHDLAVGNTATTQINLGGIGTTHTGPKILYVEADRSVKIDFVTAHAATNLTAKTNFGNAIQANGFYLAALTNTTAVWITNRTTLTATVKVAILKV